MKARLVLACAAAGVAMSAFGTAQAGADNGFSGTIGFSPDVVSPGGVVDLLATCDDRALESAPVLSSILDAPDLRRYDHETGERPLTSHAKVKKDAKPGSWPVSFTCGTTTVTGHLRVVGPKPAPYAAIGVDDRKILPGQEVRVSASCQDPSFTGSKIVSPVLTAPDLRREKGAPVDSPMFSTGRIDKNARPGKYPISFTCVGKKVTGEFTVESDKKPPVQAQVPVKPKGAPETGDLENPSDSTALVLGGAGAALLVSAGAGGWLYRRHRQRA
jgi:hypothetical protein